MRGKQIRTKSQTNLHPRQNEEKTQNENKKTHDNMGERDPYKITDQFAPQTE